MARELRELLGDEALMESLGRLFAGDFMVGTGEKLYRPNVGNLLYTAWTGRRWELEASVVAAQYRCLAGVSPVRQMTIDVDRWWENVLEVQLKKGLMDQAAEQRRRGMAPPSAPRPHEWAQARRWFGEGLEGERKRLERVMEGPFWSGVGVMRRDTGTPGQRGEAG